MRELRYFSIELLFNYWNVSYGKLKDESSQLQRIFSYIALMTQTLQCQGKQTRLTATSFPGFPPGNEVGLTEFKKMRDPFHFSSSYTISTYLLQFRAILSQFVVLYAVVSLAGTVKTIIITLVPHQWLKRHFEARSYSLPRIVFHRPVDNVVEDLPRCAIYSEQPTFGDECS